MNVRSWSLLCCLILAARVAMAGDTPFKNTQSPEDVLSSPQEALAAIRLPKGFQATLFASEPQVQQPIHFTFDARGRLWVAENYTYAERPVNFAEDQRDRIVILEDRDGDGRCDERKVFWDQAEKLTSVAVGFGGVWALCAPKLLFIPDRDGDDRPDGEPVVVLDGWNDFAVRHNIVNGLTWGPDGWLYGRHGITATSLVGKPGTPDAERMAINCGIWRYHPTRQVCEAVVHGTTNPWGLDFDEHGQMFFSNTVIGHLWHVVPGAHFERMYGVDFNPHLYQLIGQCADHFHWDSAERWSDIRQGMSDRTSQLGGGHAHCGLMIYQGDNWPAEYRNNLFMINLHGQRINRDLLERHGSGYVARHGEDMVQFGDRWFRGIELASGPDGGVYVADWSDVGECHENDGVHRTSGRIYKITYGQAKRNGPRDLAALTDSELVALQMHANEWYVRQARRLLQERRIAGNGMTAARDALLAMFAGQPDVRHKLRAMWCLHVIDGLSSTWTFDSLSHPEEHVRVWGVKLLVERAGSSSAVAKALTTVAEKDRSSLVRLFVASSLQRLPLENRWPIARALAMHGEDTSDRMLPLMIWYGIEPAVPKQPQAAVALAETSQVPLLRRHIARRLTSELDHQPLAVEKLLQLLASPRSTQFQLDLLSGMNDALRGWQKAPQPANWSKVSTALLKSAQEEVRSAAQELATVFGDGRGLEALEKLAADADADVSARRNALRVLVDNRAAIASLLQKLLDDRALVGEAVKALAYYDHPDTPKLVLRLYDRLDARGRQAAIDTLTARPEYARTLLERIEEGAIAASDISAYHVRQMLSFDDAQLRSRLTKLWGTIRESPAERKQQIAELKAALTTEELALADLPHGRLLFNKACANCHTLFGQGAKIGPDLTGANRKNLDYLLENIVDPSATLAANFRMSVIALTDGRVVTGVIVEHSERTLTVQTQRERVVLNRREVEEISEQPMSLMPDGLLANLTAAEIRDLVAYLSGSSQVQLPADAAETPSGENGQ